MRLAPCTLAIAASIALASAPAGATELKSRSWMLQHLGPQGLAKCRAIKAVRRHAAALQQATGGPFSSAQRHRLEQALKTAKARSPHSVTAGDCGVPL